VLTEPLASKGLSLWLRCSGFQASCNNINNKQKFDSEEYVEHTVITALQRIDSLLAKQQQ
jgi:hypothetical protein